MLGINLRWWVIVGFEYKHGDPIAFLVIGLEY